jgi:hypothetical protein
LLADEEMQKLVGVCLAFELQNLLKIVPPDEQNGRGRAVEVTLVVLLQLFIASIAPFNNCPQ